VIGTVVDRNGRAVSGVTVMSDNAQYLASTTTGTDGHYQLRGLVPGSDAIDVVELGCSVDVTLIAGETMTVDVIC
jgi:protocatechuate 3,4-dioxygenase beta subunit